MIGTLTALQDTYLKINTSPSEKLEDNEKVPFKKGESIQIAWIVDDIVNGHRQIQLTEFLKGRSNWYTYIDHWDVTEEMHPKMNDYPYPKKIDNGVQFSVPGYGDCYSLDYVPGCKHIKWYEITHNLQRIPNHSDILSGVTPQLVAARMISISQAVDKIRERYGVPVTITSGYRPPTVNKAVGGASNSRHMYGDALDVYFEGIYPQQVYRDYNATWIGGLASGRGFTHFDLRGYKARWTYP